MNFNKSLSLLLIFMFIVIPKPFTTQSLTNSQNSIASSRVFNSQIAINNNSDLDQFIKNNVYSGEGSQKNPYIIDNLTFSVQYTIPTEFNQTNLPLLTIQSTNRYLIIKNCLFDRGSYTIGMFVLKNASHIEIIQNTFNSGSNINGLEIEDSHDIIIKDNFFINNYNGIYLTKFQNINNLTLNEQIDIRNNYFESNVNGIFTVNQNYVHIHNDYFKNNINTGIYIFQSANKTVSNINYNIFDDNGNGILFYYYTHGMTYIYWNHFYNQKSFSIYFYGNYSGSIYENNFIYNTTEYCAYAIGSYQNETTINLDNGTKGNYIADFQGNTNITAYGFGSYSLYPLDDHRLQQPVIFFFSINGKTYTEPFPNSSTSSRNNSFTNLYL